MHLVFSRAEEVVVWLGEESETSGTAMHMIDILSEHPKGRLYWGNARGERCEYSSSVSLHEEGNINGKTLGFGNLYEGELDEWFVESVVDLMNRPWWNRVWILQEIVLAKKGQVFCGGRSLPWDDMELAMTRLAESSDHHVRTRQILRKHHTLRDMLLITELRGILRERSCKIPLLYLLYMQTERKATDPRDRIHAMRGLTTEDWHALGAPDYTKSVAQVYLETTLQMISQTGSLDVLSHVWEPNHKLGQPSWVPNWASEKLGRVLRLSPGEEGLFRAAGASRAKFQHSGKFLTLVGILIDSVNETAEPLDYETEFEKFWRGWVKMFRMDSDPYRPYVGGRDFCNAFWRTLICNMNLWSERDENGQQVYRQAPEQDRLAFLVWTGRMDPPKDFLKDHPSKHRRTMEFIKNYRTRVFGQMRNRRLFMTTKGYLGSAPISTKLGDKVCVLLGGATPFVVRPEGDCYKLVGECYVQGLMDGEVMHALKQGRYELQDFKFH
jgi:hypothetical protein